MRTTLLRTLGTVGVLLLALLPGVSAPTYAGADHEDSTASAQVTTELVGKKARSKLRPIAASSAARSARTTAVRQARPPARPAPGRYRDKSNTVTFSVKAGKIRKFRVSGTLTRCGGYPNPFTYSYNSYNFPNTKIPRNGIVDRTQRKKLYTVKLSLRIAGAKAKKGSFTYYGPNRCYANETFTAKRIRR